MCGGDDHLAWKRPVSSEACRGLRTAGGIGPLFLVLIYLCGSEQRRSTFRIRIFTLSLGIVSWIRVEGRLVRVSDTPDMDQQVVTVDQFTAAMASIQEALASLRQEIVVSRASPYVLHGHSEIAPPAVAQAVVADDTHARMDRIEQCMRQMRVSDGSVVWDDFGGMPVASLPAKFRMPDIERYTGIGCPRLHLRLYSTVMRAHGLDEPQMITLFPLSLSGAAQRWFASLESSRRRTWDDLAQEFLRQFSFNTVVDVSRRELEALRQRTEESVSSFISRWRGKIAEIVDRPSERDQIQMDGITRGLWADSSPSDVKGKKPFIGPRPTEVGAISSSSQRPSDAISRSHSFLSLILPMHLISTGHGHLVRHRAAMLRCSVHRETCGALSPTWSPADFCSVCFEDAEAVFADRHAVEPGSSEAYRGWFIDCSHPRPLPQPIPAQFRMDLHCAYHQGPGHETDRCTALRHAIQDLIDQGLVHLGQPSVTTNPLPTHTTHAVPPPAGGIHFLDFDETDDHVHMLSWDDPDPEPIMPAGIYETSGVTLEPQMPAPFRLVPEAASVQAPLPSL
ncbi:hypothetical protein CK203_063712 [Vitis vinifera]|uniref:Retrotransposon gag domain-containing protein n=1 Tax=Vitis vinifera TaxID=29760 RepID=A0A438GA91_VITVI|nr:hypothetical protein CK203_063712 [Vitis vinifera]